MRRDRLDSMESYVLGRGTATLEEIAQHFGVSINTVRRDISELLQRGSMEKVYGGVSAARASSKLLNNSEREKRNVAEKRLIGRLAAGLVKDSAVIFLDSGSTTPCIIPYLADRVNVTVVTHSLPAMLAASKLPNLRLISLSGQYSHATASFFGASTTEMLTSMRFDLAFIAATGVSREHGLSNTTYYEADIKRTVASHNSRIVLMADHSKFARSAPFSFCAFDSLYAVVSDRELPEDCMDCVERKRMIFLSGDSGGE